MDDQQALIRVGVLVVMALVWLFVNLKAGDTWLKVVSLIGCLGFALAASQQALVYVGLL